MQLRIDYQACPLCDSKKIVKSSVGDCSKHPLYKPEIPKLMQWMDCQDCTHQFVSGYFSEAANELIFSGTHENQKVGFQVEQQRAISARMIEKIIPLKSSGAWLDVGFGNGSLLFTAQEYGFHAIGAIKLGGSESEPFMGRDFGHQRDYSENVAGIVDREIRTLIENAHQEAFDILVANRSILDEMVLQLLDKETLNKDEISEIFSKVKAWPRRPAWTGSATRIPSDKPPVAVPAKIVAEAEPVKKVSKRKPKSE